MIYYVPKRPRYIMSNLILTGFGWSEYAVAAAVALKDLPGEDPVTFSVVPQECFGKAGRAIAAVWKRAP